MFSARELAGAGLRAAGYAAMNITLAMGVLCGLSGVCTAGGIYRTSAGFGAVMALLLSAGNMLYLRHPRLLEAPFPMIALLSRCGRTGFLMSVCLMYLSILTTLTAVIYALRHSVKKNRRPPWVQKLLTLGIPLLISCMGFSGIVDRFYAPAGLLCLAVVFYPLCKNISKQRPYKEKLDNQPLIQ